jgi:hypothetical protein
MGDQGTAWVGTKHLACPAAVQIFHYLTSFEKKTFKNHAIGIEHRKM